MKKLLFTGGGGAGNEAIWRLLNNKIIFSLSKKLELTPIFKLASSLGLTGQRSDRLIKMNELMKSNCYLSPEGSREYIEKDGAFKNSN